MWIVGPFVCQFYNQLLPGSSPTLQFSDEPVMSLMSLDIKRHSAIKMMIASATIVSTAGLIFRSLESVDAFGVVFFRGLALSSVMLIILWALYRRKVFSTIWSVGRQGVLGALFFTGAQTFYVFAFSNTTVANTTFTIALAPFITALIAFFVIGERIERTTLQAMATACLGIILIIATDVSSEGFLGIFFALMTAFCFSCFAVTLRRNKHIEMLPVLLLTGFFSMIVGLAFGQWRGIPGMYDIALCFIWGGVLQGCGQSLLVLSTRVLKAAEIPLIMLLEFSLGPIWVWMFFEETISRGTLFGGGLIFLSVFGLAIYEIRKQRVLS
jgi:drug/metabolite transporter (DMT)-like permease